jgi:hypothetical protein
MLEIIGFILAIAMLASYASGVLGLLFKNDKWFWFSEKFPALKKKRFALPLHFFVYPFILAMMVAIIVPDGATHSSQNAADTSAAATVEPTIVGEAVGKDQPMPELDPKNNNNYISAPEGFVPNVSAEEGKQIAIEFLNSVWTNVPADSPTPDLIDRGNGRLYQHDGRLYHVFTIKNTKLKEKTFAIDVATGKMYYCVEDKLFGLDRWLKYLDDVQKRDAEMAKAEKEKWNGIKVLSATSRMEYGLLRGDAILMNTNNESKTVQVIVEGYDDNGIFCGKFGNTISIPAGQKYHLDVTLPNPCTRYSIVGCKE